MKIYIITILLLLPVFIVQPKLTAAQTTDAYITRQVNSKIAKSVIESNHPKGKRNAKGKANAKGNRNINSKPDDKPYVAPADFYFTEDWNRPVGGNNPPLFSAVFKFTPLDSSKKSFIRLYEFTEKYFKGDRRIAKFRDIPGGNYTVTGEVMLKGDAKTHQIYFSKEDGNLQNQGRGDDRVFMPSFELKIEPAKDYYGDQVMTPDIDGVWFTIK